ncbi:fibronectin type III domain-containing protein [Anaeromyxobacter oryzae]|uniref:Fibronectin type-III domain-containing protein n=1 Tax=Anaeromyxobacter oryzae TaxID=2918170 RepID=A0ABM7WP32_9BACT|nr:fibronectin type III domain-containing protein [Anaeromyxobacter oryzae]BDG01214.1 hypothetical protein AMOR_02100 [Anaeromyxobacter oryzae]
MRPASFVALCATSLLVSSVPLDGRAQTVSPVDLTALAGPSPQQAPDVAFDGATYLVVWEEGATVWGALLDAGGTVVAQRFQLAPPAAPGAAQATPAVAAASGGGFLVVWAEAGPADWDVRAARVSSSGQVLDPSGFDVSTVSEPAAGPAPGPQERPAVAALGSEFLVVWQDGRNDPATPAIMGAVVRMDGTLPLPDGVAVSQQASAHRSPRVASNGADWLVAWEDVPLAGTADVVAARVSAAGAVSPESTVSGAAEDQLAPVVASNGGGYLVAWRDARSGAWELTAARLDDTGVLDPAGVPLAAAGAGAPLAVASDGIGYLAVYQRAGAGAFGARIRATPSVGAEFAVDAAAASPGQGLAFAGYGRYLAVHRVAAGGVARLAAAFVTTTERLDVAVQGTAGSVTSTPPGIDCGPTCSADVETGATLTLTATASAGSAFASWSGCTPLSGTSCTLTMTASASVTASFAAALPGTPGVPTYRNVGTASVSVDWTAAPDATSHELERAGDAGGAPGAFQVVFAGAATSFDDGGLSPNTPHWYRVRGLNGAGAGTFGSATSVTTLPGAPGAPSLTGVTATSVTLNWNAPEGGAPRYLIERLAPAGSWTAIASGVTATTHVDAGLAPNATYAYRVRGENATGSGPASAQATATTLADAPGTPTFAAIDATSVTVSWTAPAGGASGYDLERGPAASGPFAAIAAGIGATSAIDTGLGAATTYWYRVRAYGAGGVPGTYSAAASVLTRPAAPGAPVVATVSDASLAVSWTAVAGATGYRLEQAASAAGPWTLVAAGLTAASHTVTGLAANASYWYRVCATNATGDGAFSPAAAGSTLPAAPGAPTFTAITATSLTASWSAPAGGAASYDLERATSATGTFTRVATGVTGPSAPDASLSTGTTYWYRVRAVSAAGPGAYSATSQVITLPGAPGTPTFSAIGAGSVTLAWAAAAGGATYLVERAPDGGAGAPGTFSQVASGLTATTWTNASGLAPNTRYWYRVRARNASGTGEYSAFASVTTLPGAPGAPTFSLVTTSTLTVSWTASAGGATRYELGRGTSATGPWTVLTTGAGLGYADTGLAAGTTYWYRVRAANADGLWTAYATASVPTIPPAPGSPAFPAIDAASLTVSWPAATGATSYALETAPAATGPWTTVAVVTSGTTFMHTALLANTTYWYRVRASNASGDGAYSPAASATTLPNVPGKPTFADVTSTSITVLWTAPAQGAAAYDLERAPSANGPWSPVATGTTALSATDSGLQPGTTCYYRLRAVNAAGGASGWSAILAVTTLPTAPGAPTFSGVSTVSLTIQWSPITGATTYHVERAPDPSGPWTVVAAGLTGSYYNDAATANTAYWYRVRGANASGYGPYSPASTVTTLTNAPGAPTFSNVTTTSVTVTWTAPAGGAASYVVERATAAAGPWARVVDGVAATSWVDATLSPGTTYWYRIRGVNAAAAAGLTSTSASVRTTAAAPAAPGAPTFTNVRATSLTIAWTDASGATTYKLERAADAGGAPGAWTQIAVIAAKSWVDMSLSANTSYWYRVRGSNTGGDGPYSTAPVITAPNVPGTLSVGSVTTTSAALSWTEPAGGATTYELERAPGSAGPWTTAAVVPALTHAESSLSAGTTYWYRVRALNAAGTAGAYSGVRSVITLADRPGAPSFTEIAATSVTVQWAAAAGAARYNVQRATGANGVWTNVATSLLTTSWTSSGLAPNTSYAYRITATNSAGTPGPYSPESPVTTLPGAPGAPSFAAVTQTSVSLAWTAPAGGAASYALERAAGSSGPWVGVARGVTALGWSDQGLAAGTVYWYRIRATNADGADGLPSTAASVRTAADETTLPGAPGAPTFTSISAFSVRIAWAPAVNATSYRLERASAGTTTWTQVVSGTGTAYTDAGRAPNASYVYRVRATNAAGDGPYSPEASVTTAPGAPAAPTFSGVAAQALTVSWTPPAGGAATYQLERGTSPFGPWSILATDLTGTSFGDSGLTGNSTYHYRLRAANAAGTAGAYSPTGSVTTAPDPAVALPGMPGTPTFTSVTAMSVGVTWAVATNATGYEIERAVAEGGPWTQIGADTTPPFTSSGLAANTTYWYRVRGTTAGGDGPPSTTASVVTAPGVPGTPTFSAVTDTSVTVSWTAPPGGAAIYALERATSAAGPWAQVASATAPSWTETGLAAATTYWYRVRARSSGGAYGYYSGTRSVTTAAATAAAVTAAAGAAAFP